MDNPRLPSGNDSYENHEAIVRSPQGPTLNVPGYPEVTGAPFHETDDFAVFMQYVWILWKHKWALVFGLMLGGLASLAVTLWLTPMYRATTSIEIQNVQEPFGAPMVTVETTLVTQSQLLSSKGVRDRALSKLSGKTDAPVPKVRGPVVFLRNLFRLTDPATSMSWDDTLGVAAGTVQVTNTKDSHLLAIQSDSPNPQASADFTNTLAQEYIERNQEQRWQAYENMSALLTRAQQELKTKVEQSERRLVEFARTKGLVVTSNTQNFSEDKLNKLQAELLTASAERIKKQAVYESSLSSPSESLPSVLDSGPMGQYQAKIADLRRQLAELSATLTPAHYRVQQVQAQINELEAAREKERTNIISRIRIEYDAALKRENQLRGEFEAQSQVLANQANDLIEHNILLREVETNKKLYEAALQQGKEASLASAMRTSSARIVDAASVPRVPRTPNLPLNLSLGMCGGLFLCAAIVVLRSRSDVRVQVPGVLEFDLNVRELGVIPSAKADPAIRALPASSKPSRPSSKAKPARLTTLFTGNLEPTNSLEMVTWNQKHSVMAEAFRSTMTSILFSGENGDRPKVLVVTSPSPREGKTTVISNLAIALAEINHRVLLIDADMRLPRLHTIFDLPNTFGLSDVLHERTPIGAYLDESLVRKASIPDLYLLPAGPARMNLSRLLYSTRMQELIDRFRQTFDTILIDSAPVLTVPDARIIARAADAIILVVRAHQTEHGAAFAAAKCFEEDGRQILGTILNDWDPKTSLYGSYDSYGAYYSRYRLHDE